MNTIGGTRARDRWRALIYMYPSARFSSSALMQSRSLARDGCSQSPGLWIMHTIFTRGKRNVRARSRIYIHKRTCTSVRIYYIYVIYVQYVYAFWWVRRWNRTVIRMIYTRWTVGLETCRPVVPRSSSYFESIVPLSSVSSSKKEILPVWESRVNCRINARSPLPQRDFLFGDCLRQLNACFGEIISRVVHTQKRKMLIVANWIAQIKKKEQNYYTK